MNNHILIIDDVIEDRGVIDFLINKLIEEPIPMNTFIKKNDVFKRGSNELLNTLKQVIGKGWYDVAYDLLAAQDSRLV